MKKALAVIFAAIFIAVLFPLSVSAEEIKAPTLQYKILNHDKVSLKWSKVEGAESYYIYKRDDKTGEYIKKFEVKSNKVTLKNLSPDTEYSYSVVAVKGGEESKSSNKVTFTTPSEWYYSFESNESNPWGTYYFCDWKDSGQCYRQHYDGTGKEIFKIDFIYKALVEYYDENYSPPGYELRVQCQNKGYVYFNVLIYDDGDYYNPDFGLRDT
ncbi:MAG: fibronectin type III domain-containing protein [Oscillospiraceae bacterium]|nr:fibronectin type III domain-containing protein [Oscillospiraceae bacterium]